MSAEPPQQPTEEELKAALKELKVEDILLQTAVSLINLTGRRLTVDDEKDVEQAHQGIEGVRAMLPLLPEEEGKQVQEALAQLQMIYVREKQGPSSEEEQQASQDEAERAAAREKLWTPPGT